MEMPDSLPFGRRGTAHARFAGSGSAASAPKVLTEQLRQLEADGLVAREVFAEVLTRVEYRLSEEGKTFLPALYMLCDWGKAYGLRHGTATSPCPPPAD